MKLNVIAIALLCMAFTSCNKLISSTEENNQNQRDFEYLNQLVKTKYPFLKFKHINWDSLVSAYQPRVDQAQGDEVYPVFHSLLSNLKDGHIQLITEGGFPMQTYIWPRYKDHTSFSQVVISTYFNQKLQLAGEGNFAYGILPNNAGYIYLSSFEEGDWATDIDKILRDLSNTKGLILDVRNNGGGSSNISDVIISRFISTHITETFYYKDGTINSQLQIQPSGFVKYYKPVVILINGASFSCAELLPDLMKQLPNVTTVGDTTGGGGGSTQFFTLPSRKRIRMPYAFFVQSKDSKMVEWNGIVPDIVVPQTAADVANGVDKQLEQAIKLLK
ncbi:MAG: S41 family peptidase [Bacteroidales bacterium]